MAEIFVLVGHDRHLESLGKIVEFLASRARRALESVAFLGQTPHMQATQPVTGTQMKKPNFDFERRERDKAKAAKKAEKAAAKASKGPVEDNADGSDPSQSASSSETST